MTKLSPPIPFMSIQLVQRSAKGLEGADTYCQEELEGAVSHLYVLVLQQASRDRDVAMVLWGPVGRGRHRSHHASRAIFHPPGSMHRNVESQDEVCFLQEGRW